MVGGLRPNKEVLVDQYLLLYSVFSAPVHLKNQAHTEVPFLLVIAIVRLELPFANFLMVEF